MALLCSNLSFSATVIAVNDGDWDVSSTWAKQIAGTVSFTSGSTTVTGSGTAFSTQLALNSKLYDIDRNLLGTVASITSNTELELSVAASSDVAGIDCFAPWTNGGASETGQLTTDNTSTTVTGTLGTAFTAYEIGSDFYSRSGIFPNFTYHYLGTVGSIATAADCEFEDNATETVADQQFYLGGYPELNGENDIIIPAGVSVSIPSRFNSGNLSQKMFVSIDISGSLTVAGGAVLDQWALPNDNINLRSGGNLSINGDLNFITNRTNISIENGSKLFVGGDIRDGGAGPVGITNYGYIEVDGDISSRQINLTNEVTGVLMAHGQVAGNGSAFVINNYGVIIADIDLNLNYVDLYNHTQGQILVYGNITILGSTSYINAGLIQCLNMDFYNKKSFINTGTTIVQQTFTLYWSGCPCSFGDFYAETVVVQSSHWIMVDGCGGVNWCGEYWTERPEVPANRKIWLAADNIGAGQQTDGEKVYRWFDIANTYGLKMTEPDESLQPVLKNNSSDNINYNPLVSFAGGEKHLDLGGDYLFADAAAGGIAFCAVVVPGTGGTADQLIFDIGDYIAEGYGFGYSSSNAYMYTATNHGGSVLQDAHGNSSAPVLITMKSVFGGQQEIYYNGVLATSNTNTLTALDASTLKVNSVPNGSSGPVTLGGKSKDPSASAFEGGLAEMLVYSKDLHDTSRLSAQSFLALKYGLTLPHDYTDYNNKTVWSADATYKYDIAGLAREDLNFLHQSIATSSNNPKEMVVSMGMIDGVVHKDELTQRIDTNSTYLIWAHDNGSLANCERIYKVTSTQFNQEVNIQFNIPGLTEDPLLLVADDDGFSINTDFISPTSHVGDKINYSYHFKKNKSCYFRLFKVAETIGEPGVGINTVAVDSSAQLHIHSGDKGILLPALVDETAISSSAPPEGLLFYNTTQSRFMYNAGTASAPVWKYIGAPLKQADADLQADHGSYDGEIRYNTTTKTMWMWDGANWLQLKND